jgi:hypothetical protein
VHIHDLPVNVFFPFPNCDASVTVPLFVTASVDSKQEEVMHIPIRSERQRRRALRILLEIEAEHVAQCETPETCKMLRELRDDIAELKAPPNNKEHF